MIFQIAQTCQTDKYKFWCTIWAKSPKILTSVKNLTSISFNNKKCTRRKKVHFLKFVCLFRIAHFHLNICTQNSANITSQKRYSVLPKVCENTTFSSEMQNQRSISLRHFEAAKKNNTTITNHYSIDLCTETG